MSSYPLMFPGVRSSLMFSGFELKPPVSGCSDQPGKRRMALSSEQGPVMTTEGDPAATELKGSFFLFSSSLADGGMDVFL